MEAPLTRRDLCRASAISTSRPQPTPQHDQMTDETDRSQQKAK